LACFKDIVYSVEATFETLRGSAWYSDALLSLRPIGVYAVEPRCWPPTPPLLFGSVAELDALVTYLPQSELRFPCSLLQQLRVPEPWILLPSRCLQSGPAAELLLASDSIARRYDANPPSRGPAQGLGPPACA
jgi:hypothetical protein